MPPSKQFGGERGLLLRRSGSIQEEETCRRWQQVVLCCSGAANEGKNTTTWNVGSEAPSCAREGPKRGDACASRSSCRFTFVAGQERARPRGAVVQLVAPS